MASHITFIQKAKQNYTNLFFSSENLHFHMLFLLFYVLYIVALQSGLKYLLKLLIEDHNSTNYPSAYL